MVGAYMIGIIQQVAAERTRTKKQVPHDGDVTLRAPVASLSCCWIHRGVTAFAMDTDSILQLRKAGVSDEVLRPMLASAK